MEWCAHSHIPMRLLLIVIANENESNKRCFHCKRIQFASDNNQFGICVIEQTNPPSDILHAIQFLALCIIFFFYFAITIAIDIGLMSNIFCIFHCAASIFFFFYSSKLLFIFFWNFFNDLEFNTIGYTLNVHVQSTEWLCFEPIKYDCISHYNSDPISNDRSYCLRYAEHNFVVVVDFLCVRD